MTTLNNDTILTVTNRNLFTRHILAYIFGLAPNVQVRFQKPEDLEIAMTLYFNERLGMHIKYGIPWEVLKASMQQQSPFDLPSTDSITDDTIINKKNIGVFLEKIRELAPDEDIELERLAMAEGITIHFIDRRTRMSLWIGDKWKQTYTYMQQTKERLKDTVFTFPICMETKGKGCTAVSCVECLKAVCSECLITLFIRNEGLVICPHCRHTFGRTLPPCIVEATARDMRLRVQGTSTEYEKDG